MPQCVAFGCFSRSEGKHTLYSFPKNAKDRKIWLSKVKRDKWKPGTDNDIRLCAKHFASECFEITEEQSVQIGVRRKLIPGSIPTIFSYTTPIKSRTRTAVEKRSAIQEMKTTTVTMSMTVWSNWQLANLATSTIYLSNTVPYSVTRSYTTVDTKWNVISQMTFHNYA